MFLGRSIAALAVVACGGHVAGADAGTDAGTDTSTADAAVPAGWSACLGKTSTYGSCDQFCAAQGKTCSATCTTSRGYPNLGAEAWWAGMACSGNGSGQQTCAFAWDDVVGAEPRWRCCCH